MSPNTQWLVRKLEGVSPDGDQHRIVVLGPYLKDQVCRMIEQGVVGENDEICPENGYWIFLRDSAEVKKHLGISIHFAGGADEDTTLPGLADQERTAPDFGAIESTAQGNPESTGVIKIERPKPAAQAAQSKTPGFSAAALSKEYPRQSLPQSVLLNMRPNIPPKPTFFGIEKGRFLVYMILVGCACALFGVLWLLRSLKPMD